MPSYLDIRWGYYIMTLYLLKRLYEFCGSACGRDLEGRGRGLFEL
jgi:hypothetical protein